MRIKADLVRDILVFVEDNTDMTHWVSGNELSDAIRYDDGDIIYHVRYLAEAGYIKTDRGVEIDDDKYAIIDLTPIGHKFTEEIRSNSTWKKVKTTAKSVGAFSLETLQKIAVQVISAQIMMNHPQQ